MAEIRCGQTPVLTSIVLCSASLPDTLTAGNPTDHVRSSPDAHTFPRPSSHGTPRARTVLHQPHEHGTLQETEAAIVARSTAGARRRHSRVHRCAGRLSRHRRASHVHPHGHTAHGQHTDVLRGQARCHRRRHDPQSSRGRPAAGTHPAHPLPHRGSRCMICMIFSTPAQLPNHPCRPSAPPSRECPRDTHVVVSRKHAPTVALRSRVVVRTPSGAPACLASVVQVAEASSCACMEAIV